MRYGFSYYQVDARSPRELVMSLIDFYQLRGYYDWKIVSNHGTARAENHRNGWQTSISVQQTTLLGTLAKEVKITRQWEEDARRWR